MTDVRAAQNAQMKVVCVNYGYNRGDDLAKECRLITNLSQLI
jgi:phosphoglycolate phosphatase-like HAD superfamily hydrolase